jgi:hypothetical protein
LSSKFRLLVIAGTRGKIVSALCYGYWAVAQIEFYRDENSVHRVRSTIDSCQTCINLECAYVLISSNCGLQVSVLRNIQTDGFLQVGHFYIIVWPISCIRIRELPLIKLLSESLLWSCNITSSTARTHVSLLSSISSKTKLQGHCCFPVVHTLSYPREITFTTLHCFSHILYNNVYSY